MSENTLGGCPCFTGYGETVLSADEFDNPAERRRALMDAKALAFDDLATQMKERGRSVDDLFILTQSHSFDLLPLNLGGRHSRLVTYDILTRLKKRP